MPRKKEADTKKSDGHREQDRQKDLMDRMFEKAYQVLREKAQNLVEMAASLQDAYQAFYPGQRIIEDLLKTLIWDIVRQEIEIFDAFLQFDKFDTKDEYQYLPGMVSRRITQKIMELLKERGFTL